MGNTTLFPYEYGTRGTSSFKPEEGETQSQIHSRINKGGCPNSLVLISKKRKEVETAVYTDAKLGSPAEKHIRAHRFSLFCVFLSDAQCSPHKVQPIQNAVGTSYKMGDRNQ